MRIRLFYRFVKQVFNSKLYQLQKYKGVFLDYLHYDLNLNVSDIVVVTLDKRSYVRLLDDLNYSKYRKIF